MLKTTAGRRPTGLHLDAFRAILALLLGLVFVPVAITQVLGSEARRLTSVGLEETTYQEIRFTNTEQGLELAGMLFVPPGIGPFPAAVIIHGSGTSRRDNGWYLTLAQFLQEQGIVALLPDKRGSEESAGDWRSASFEDLATDTVAAVTYLISQTDVLISSVGVIGLSQGGWIAPLVASLSKDVSSVVSIVGPAVTVHETVLYEETQNLRQMGFLPGIADVLAYATTWMSPVDAFDPLPYWKALSVPALAIYGQDDTNVPTEASTTRLRSLENPEITVNVYAGSGHAIEDPPDQGDSIFREDALADIVDFIRVSTPEAEWTGVHKLFEENDETAHRRSGGHPDHGRSRSFGSSSVRDVLARRPGAAL